MFNAILADQEAFVSLFMENGFDLEAFLTVHMLEKLYTAGLSKRESKTELIQQLWENCRIYKMDWVMLRDIGRVVRQLLGEFYRPYYLSKRFREVIKRAISRHEAEAKEVLITGNPWSKRSSRFASFSTEQTLTAPLDPDAPPAEASSLSATPVEPPKTLIKHEGILKQPTEMQRSSNSFVLQAGKRRGVVMPIPLEVGNGGMAVSENGLIGGGPVVPAAVSANGRQPPLGNGRNGRGVVRLIANGSAGTGGRSIWSVAPVALEEPELESPPPRRRRQRHLKSDSSVSGEINPTFQRSPSEQSNETSSQPTAPASDPSRKASSVESKQTVVTARGSTSRVSLILRITEVLDRYKRRCEFQKLVDQKKKKKKKRSLEQGLYSPDVSDSHLNPSSETVADDGFK
nr:unnamed protein product [Spirometra erinaceieuropaei]